MSGRSGCVLITGAAGFIGSSAAGAFARLGWEVRRLDRSPCACVCEAPQDWLVADLLFGGWQFLIEGCDVVVHLAGQPGARNQNRALHERDNVIATRSLVDALDRHPGVRVIFASSSSVYGEGRDRAMRETDPCAPLHAYGRSKLKAESTLARQLGDRSLSLRLFTVYGPGQRPDMLVARAIHAGLTGVPLPIHDLTVRRDFTFVDDVVAAIVAAAVRQEASGVVNVGSGTEWSVAEVLALVGEHLGAEVPTKLVGPVEEASRTQADLTRVRGLLDYEPKWSLERGVARQISTVLQTIATCEWGGASSACPCD